MQIQKFLTTLALVTLGSIATMQATSKQQRDFMDSLSTSTPANSDFLELSSDMYDATAKIQPLIKEHKHTAAMAANSDSWLKANRPTLAGTANNATTQVSKQLHKEKTLIHGKLKKIDDAHKLIQKHIEQAHKIINDNRSERDNRLTTAVQEIGISMVPMTKLELARKEAQAKSEPSKPKKAKKVQTGRRQPDEQYGKDRSHKSKMAASDKKMKASKKDKSAKKDAKPKKEKKSKKGKKRADELDESSRW